MEEPLLSQPVIVVSTPVASAPVKVGSRYARVSRAMTSTWHYVGALLDDQSDQVSVPPVIATIVGSACFGLLACYNYHTGRKALLLDMGKGPLAAVGTFMLWDVAIPVSLWNARQTKKKVKEANQKKFDNLKEMKAREQDLKTQKSSKTAEDSNKAVTEDPSKAAVLEDSNKGVTEDPSKTAVEDSNKGVTEDPSKIAVEDSNKAVTEDPSKRAAAKADIEHAHDEEHAWDEEHNENKEANKHCLGRLLGCLQKGKMDRSHKRALERAKTSLNRSLWWASAAAVTVWVMFFLEVRVWVHYHASGCEPPCHHPRLSYVGWPIPALAFLIFCIFRYVALVAQFAQASIITSVDKPAYDIHEHIDQGKAGQLDWSKLLIGFYEGLKEAGETWDKFSFYFHGLVLISFWYVASAAINIAREWNNLNVAVHVATGDDIYDLFVHNITHIGEGWQAVETDHLATVALLALNVVYLACGLWSLFETLLLMGSLNSTAEVKNAATRYLLHSKDMTEEEKKDFFRFVNMLQRLKATTNIAKLFSFPVTRRLVFELISRYVVQLPVFLFLLTHFTRKTMVDIHGAKHDIS